MSDLPSPLEARKHLEWWVRGCVSPNQAHEILASADLMVKEERERAAKIVEGGHWFPAQTDLARRIRDSL